MLSVLMAALSFLRLPDAAAGARQLSGSCRKCSTHVSCTEQYIMARAYTVVQRYFIEGCFIGTSLYNEVQ